MGQVLDLDETLVHSTLDTCDAPDFAFSVDFNGRLHTVNVRRRPHLATFLEAAAALFEVVVFTASQKVYAEQLINVLDPGRHACASSPACVRLPALGAAVTMACLKLCFLASLCLPNTAYPVFVLIAAGRWYSLRSLSCA